MDPMTRVDLRSRRLPREPGSFRIALLSPALIDEPLGAMYVGAALRRAGYDVTGVLVNGTDATPASVVDRILSFDPHVVAFGVITGEHVQCLELSRRLAAVHDHFTVLGGPFLTFAPQTIEDHAHIDAVARGECEGAMVELCDRLRTGEDHTGVHNFWFRTEEGIVRNPLGPLPALDDLPLPDRHLFGDGTTDGVYNVITSRGCPYKCTYCFNDRYVELHRPRSAGGERAGDEPAAVVRTRSIPAVVEELRGLAERFDVRQFNIQDDIFPMRRSRTLEFCDAYRAAGLGVPWSCSVKAELLDRPLVEAMAAAGCNKVYMGVEAADDAIRQDLLLRHVERTQMVEAAEIVRAAGIQLYSQSMVGLPGTTIDDDLATMRFNALLRPTFAWVSIFTPYPGTALADRADELGLVDPDFMATMPNTYHYRSILRTPHAHHVGNLHKLFSLGVEHPELIDAIEALLAASETDDLDALHHRVFLPFRNWKHAQLRTPETSADADLGRFIDLLRDGRPDAALAFIRSRPGDGHADGRHGRSQPWTHRDGVDATATAPMVPVRSADRHAAEP